MERITVFKEVLSRTLSRRTDRKNCIDDVVESVSAHPDELPALYTLITDTDEKTAWRAAWACKKLAEKNPEWFLDKRTSMMEIALHTKHSGIKRELLSTLLNQPLDDVMSIAFFNGCMEWMFSPGESVAVQAFSIHLAYKLCEYEPELMPELQVYLENTTTGYFSAGIQSAVKNTLKKIRRNQKKGRK